MWLVDFCVSVISCIAPFWTDTGQQDGKLFGLLLLGKGSYHTEPGKWAKKRGLGVLVIKTPELQQWLVSAPSKAAAITGELALNRFHTILTLCLCLEQKCSHLARRCY